MSRIAGHWDWDLGAFNKYTPDGLYFRPGLMYLRVGGAANGGLKIGKGTLAFLYNPEGQVLWHIGTSNKYTPDEFAFVNPFSPRSYCTVSCEVYNHEMAGMSAFSVSSSASNNGWSTGASLSDVLSNCSENYSENNPLSKTL